MELFARLAEAVEKEHREGELPDFMVPTLLRVAEHPEEFAGQENLVETLLQQVSEYQTYSFTCCEKLGYGVEDLLRTIALLEGRVEKK
jgi:hypothetical protein